MRVRAGFYRFGKYCVHHSRKGWAVFLGPKFILTFDSLASARKWCCQS